MGRSRDLANLGDYSASSFQIDTITDTSGGNTTSINSTTPTANTNVGKNVIINGAMQIWQRANSSTSAGGYFTVDRFSIQNNTANALSSDAPSTFKNSLDMSGTPGGSSGYAIFDQNIESWNINHMIGQTVTLSAYVKNVGTSTVNLSCELYYPNSQDNFSSVTYISSPTSQAITTGWTRVTFPSFTVPANAANGLRVRLFRYDASNNQQWRITGIQLELGNEATQFEHRSYNQELDLCRRYFQVVNCGGTSIGGTWFSGTDNFYAHACTITPMRTTPSATYTNLGGGNYWVNPGIAAYSNNTFTNFGISIQTIGGGQGATVRITQQRAGAVAGGATPTSFYGYQWESALRLTFDAEL